MDSRAIGVFDSGLGGLTVVKSINALLPNESIVYLGDTARVPYGTRSKETITKFALDDVKFLLRKDVKCIVIACNTVASQASEVVRKHSVVPVVDVVEAGVKMAEKLKRIVVLATRGTVSSHAYKNMLDENNEGSMVREIACPLFVPVIEEGETEGELINLLVKKYLPETHDNKIDAIILGCTHYPLIKKAIRKYVDKSVQIIDSSTAVSQLLNEVLTENGLHSVSKDMRDTYYLTDITENFLKTAETFLGKSISDDVQHIEL